MSVDGPNSDFRKVSAFWSLSVRSGLPPCAFASDGFFPADLPTVHDAKSARLPFQWAKAIIAKGAAAVKSHISARIIREGSYEIANNRLLYRACGGSRFGSAAGLGRGRKARGFSRRADRRQIHWRYDSQLH